MDFESINPGSNPGKTCINSVVVTYLPSKQVRNFFVINKNLLLNYMSAVPDYVWFELFLSICFCNLITKKDLEKSAYKDSERYNYSI